MNTEERPVPHASEEDVEGHAYRRFAPMPDSTEDDIEGHVFRSAAPDEPSEGDEATDLRRET